VDVWIQLKGVPDIRLLHLIVNRRPTESRPALRSQPGPGDPVIDPQAALRNDLSNPPRRSSQTISPDVLVDQGPMVTLPMPWWGLSVL
jgi:hypothetical protein